MRMDSARRGDELTMTGDRRGWGWPMDAKKAHYFIFASDRTWNSSLCGGWAYGGNLEDSNDDSPDNCKECLKKLQKIREREHQ